jgi:hypothetical protein
MNERIKLLATQAGFQSYITTHEEDVAMFEKFAELIVKECAEFVDYRLTNPDGASMAWCEGSDIKEHFGVEE